MDLDVVSLVTTLVALAGIAGHVRETGDFALQWNFALRHGKIERNTPNRLHAFAAFAGRIVEAGQPHPILQQPFYVNIGRNHLLTGGEPFRLG